MIGEALDARRRGDARLDHEVGLDSTLRPAPDRLAPGDRGESAGLVHPLVERAAPVLELLLAWRGNQDERVGKGWRSA